MSCFEHKRWEMEKQLELVDKEIFWISFNRRDN